MTSSWITLLCRAKHDSFCSGHESLPAFEAVADISSMSPTRSSLRGRPAPGTLRAGWIRSWAFHGGALAPQGPSQAIEIKIDDRGSEQGEDLREQQAAHDRVAERLADFRAGAGPEHQRHRSEQRRHGGHQDRPEAQHAGLIDCVLAASPFV